MLQSTMQDDYQLALLPLFRYGRQVHSNSKVITFTGDGPPSNGYPSNGYPSNGYPSNG